MKIWWRQQEMLFALSVFFVMLIDHLMMREQDLASTASSRARYFADAGVPFDYFSNSLLPFLLVFAVPVAILITFNGWLLPRLRNHPRRLVITLASLVAIWLLLSACFGLDFYLRYLPIMQKTGETAYRLDVRRHGITLATMSLLLYALYSGFREVVISWLEKTKEQQPLMVMVTNRITAVAFIYVLIMITAITFDLLLADGPAIAYTFIVLPVIVTCFVNLYIHFPLQERKRLSFLKIFPRLSLIPFALSFISWLFYIIATGHLFISAVPALFSIIMLIATPLSRILYLQQREKINTLLNLEKKLGKTAADLAFLRSQINPHFLFNTLNTLYGTALQEQATRTAAGIQRLGDMMRFLLHDNHRDTIPVIREIEYLQHYISLQSLRIADAPGIRIETSISDLHCNYSIAPMLLIPFVENAFKHGIRLTKPSYILTRLYCDEKGIHLDVVNSRHPNRESTNEEGYSGVGMENVKQRLELLYPGSYSLQVQEDDAAFQIRLFIRLHQ